MLTKLLRAMLLLPVAMLLFIQATWAAPASDDSVSLTAEALKKMGVDLSGLALGGISDDCTLALASHKETDTKEIARGHIHWIHFFHIDWKSHTVRHERLPLALPTVEQYALTPDARSLIVIGQGGTQVLCVDVDTRSVRTLFKHTKGQPGFLVGPPVFWIEKGLLHTHGYFYDANQVNQGEWAVSLDPTRTGLEVFGKVLEMTEINKRLQNACSSLTFASNQAYYSVYQKKDDQYLYLFSGDPSHLEFIDHNFRLDTVAAGQDRVLYCFRRPDTTSQVSLYDLGTKKRWQIGDGKSNYTYPYISRDGSTLLVSLFDFAGRKMSTWYAHEASQFRLVPMPKMTEVFPGTIRMSKNGKMISFFTNTGIIFRRIPQE